MRRFVDTSRSSRFPLFQEVCARSTVDGGARGESCSAVAAVGPGNGRKAPASRAWSARVVVIDPPQFRVLPAFVLLHSF
jgi:hypothetical protein